MNGRVWENPWRLMLAVNAAVMIGVFWHKITLAPYVPYLHLLVDYHFGFTKRALIGAIVSLFTDKVPVWLVFALGGAVWLVTAALFVRLFRQTFGFDREQLPLFVLMAGSPFFLKNFLHTLGHFDIYGCAIAICLLLAPARSVAFVLWAALASMVLILIHHIHLSDVRADDRSHRGAALLSGAGCDAAELPIVASPRRSPSVSCSSSHSSREPWRCRRPSSWPMFRAASPIPREKICCAIPMPFPTSGISRFPRKSAIPGIACRPTCWESRCLRC